MPDIRNGLTFTPDATLDIGTSTLRARDLYASGTVFNPTLTRDNLLANGGLEIWQRGTGAFTANGAFTADRWQINIGGTSTFSVSRDGSNNDTGSVFCAAVTYTHNAASAFEQKLEDFGGLRGRPLTVSVRVRTSTASAVQARIITQGTGAASATSSFHTGGGAYETLTATITPGTAVSAILVGVVLSASCTFQLDNCMLVRGSAAADHVPLHPADELLRCQRYYEVNGGTANEVLGVGQAISTTVAHVAIRFKVRKAVTPSMTIGASGDNIRAFASTGTAVAGSSQSCSDTTPDGTRLVHTAGTASLVAGNAVVVYSNNTSGTVIAEANP